MHADSEDERKVLSPAAETSVTAVFTNAMFSGKYVTRVCDGGCACVLGFGVNGDV